MYTTQMDHSTVSTWKYDNEKSIVWKGSRWTESSRLLHPVQAFLSLAGLWSLDNVSLFYLKRAWNIQFKLNCVLSFSIAFYFFVIGLFFSKCFICCLCSKYLILVDCRKIFPYRLVVFLLNVGQTKIFDCQNLGSASFYI